MSLDGDELWAPFRFTARDGLNLYARDYGDRLAAAIPLLCLPGLTRNSKDFHHIASRLAVDPKTPRRVVCFDYRGRGQSDWDRDWRNYSPQTEALDVFDLLTAAGMQHAIILGTSRGGIIAMIMGAMRPGMLAGVILNDVGPVIGDTGIARIKAYVGRAVAPRTWDDAIANVRQANEAQFPNLTREDWEEFARTIYREDNGRPKIDYDHAIAKPLQQIDLGERMPTLWPQFHTLDKMPLMTIRGGLSDLLTEKTFEAMQSDRPDMVTLTVAGEGHAPRLRGGAEHDAIAKFLAGIDAKAKS